MGTIFFGKTNDCANKKQQPYHNSLTINDKSRAESRLLTPGDHDSRKSNGVVSRIGGHRQPTSSSANCSTTQQNCGIEELAQQESILPEVTSFCRLFVVGLQFATEKRATMLRHTRGTWMLSVRLSD